MFFSLHTRLFSSRLRQWLGILENLYQAIDRHTGGAIIVDSSKSPMYLAALSLIPSLDVHIVHLVRDPRSVAFSRMKPKGNLRVQSPSFASLMWSFWNFAIEHLKFFTQLSYYFLRYEDFAKNPRITINSLVEYIHGTSTQLPFLDDHTVILKATHSVAGNPNRFELGEIQIKTDVRWLQNMSTWEKIVVSLLTLPFLRKYGYPLFT
jgi:hypothetical protein